MKNQQGFAVKELKKTAATIRRLILRTTHNAGCGHTGGSLSEVELLTALFFRIMNIDNEKPDAPDRDRFILSKGHATPGYYCTLAARGFFPIEELDGFDKFGSILQGHPDMHKTPGVDMSSGSLGQGLSCGIGMRIAADMLGRDYRVWVLLGDGESQEGQVWEAAMWAGSNRTRGIIGITDLNAVQLSGNTDDTLSLFPIEDKWTSFGWKCVSCNGNDMEDCLRALEEAEKLSAEGPVMVLAKTTKGCGVSFMENDFRWHGKAPDGDELERALAEIDRAEAAIC